MGGAKSTHLDGPQQQHSISKQGEEKRDDKNEESAKVDRKGARVKKLEKMKKNSVARCLCSLSAQLRLIYNLATAEAAPAFFSEQRATGRPAE